MAFLTFWHLKEKGEVGGGVVVQELDLAVERVF
jgi:hypothetical protein